MAGNSLWDGILNEIQNGLFYFTSPWNLLISVFDVLVTTLLFYYVLKLISETQAWQLLKGLLAFFALMIAASWMGLNTINYIIVNSASILAIGIIIIFQPELRKALESIGRRSSRFFSSGEGDASDSQIMQDIEAIVLAAEEMSAEKTGALITVERTTMLGDLIEGTAVVLDSELSSTILRQIFYNNSPLHDGAVIIRSGRVYAARVHVPLGDTYELKNELGTRHRAAIGASEIGDTISIVVSEETGTISLGVHGRLYQLEDADALRTILHRLLNPDAGETTANLPRTLRKILRIDKTERALGERELSESTSETLSEIESLEEVSGVEEVEGEEVTTRPRRNNAGIFAIALFAAFALWLYVRVTTNPVVQTSFEVQLQTVGIEVLNTQQLDYFAPSTNVEVTIKGRQQMIDSLTPSQIDAVIDFSEITAEGTYNLPTEVNIEGVNEYAYTIVVREPLNVSVSVYQDSAIPESEDDSSDRQTVQPLSPDLEDSDQDDVSETTTVPAG